MNLNDCETFFTEASVFSNFYMYPFTYRGHIFGCSEQAFMFEKSEFFNDTASSIMLLELDTTDRHLPGISKSIGRKVKNYSDAQWTLVREHIMFKILLAKFSIPELKDKLLATENKYLIETSPYDRIWGIGFSDIQMLTAPKEKWGQNLLGITLMNVREALK